MENKVIVSVEVKGDKAEQGLKKIDKELKSTKDSAQSTKKSLEGVDDALDALPGTAGNVAQGFKGVLEQFKALVATPVGIALVAIAGAITLIYKGLSSLNPVLDKFEDVMGGISNVLSATFVNIGNFITGQKEANISLQDAYRYGVQATQAMRDYEDGMKDLNLQNSLYDRQIDILLRKAKNQAITEKQRNDILKEALMLQDEQIKKNKEVVKLEGVSIANRVLALKGTFKQLNDIKKGISVASMNITSKELEDALYAYSNYLAKRNDLESGYDLKRERIINFVDANDLKREKVKTEKVISEVDKRLNAVYEKEGALRAKINLAQLEADAKEQAEKEQAQWDEIEAEKDLENEKIDIANKAAEERKRIYQAEAQARISTISAIGSALDGFAQLAEEQSQEAKILASANALINTYLAANQVLADKTLPTVAKAFAVAGIVAAGLANVKKINSIDAKGGGGQAASAPAPIVKPTSSFTVVNNPEPIRTSNEGGKVQVFVTESDITNTQNKVNSIKAKATL
jgi:hypothetical protein